MPIPRVLAFALIFWSAAAAAQSNSPCAATTPVQQQSRTKLKHRVPPSSPAATTVTVQEILQWTAPKGVAASPAVRRSNTAIDPKEAQIFTLEGDLWRIVTEANDCDFHLELAAPG